MLIQVVECGMKIRKLYMTYDKIKIKKKKKEKYKKQLNKNKIETRIRTGLKKQKI